MPLSKMRAGDQIYCGAKAANLGEIKAKMKNVLVPDGFSIPFAQYESFIIRNGIRERLKEIQSRPEFYEQIQYRRTALEKLRNEIESAEVDSAIVNSWIQQWNNQLEGKGVFVRSSSNAEDLKNFSGAGLFTTVPNVTSAEELEKAVKKVWASVYNFEAYESRRRAGIPDSLIRMSVFIQLAVNSDISGVMITKDPYNPIRWDITYIAAKRGIGIKVVEGKRIAEQVMYSISTKAVQLISRSEEDSELRLDEKGGVKEVPLETQSRVMSDELVEKLAMRGRKIKQIFNEDMDIEWAVAGNQIIILQARPYK
jgi:phosphoenolpyruvate synthase/pyruvate phosphate dikinase